MHGLAFIPTTNAKGKRDVTGAFKPEAIGFTKLYPGVRIVAIDNSRPMQRRQQEVLEALRTMGNEADVVAFFCHGWFNGIQLGFRTRDVPKLAAAMKAAWCTADVTVPLYACDAAQDDDVKSDDVLDVGPGGDGGFADELRDALCREGMVDCQVDAHATTAHCTFNPHVRRFSGEGSKSGGNGGGWIVRPGAKYIWPRWRTALKTTDLRFRFPFMSTDLIHAEVMRDA